MIGDGWAIGDTPPITWPVCSRTNSGVARLSFGNPWSLLTLAVSTRWAPEVKISTGVPSASKSRLLAIAPTSQPNASAAKAAVWTLAGSTTIRLPIGASMRASASFRCVRNDAMARCSADSGAVMGVRLAVCGLSLDELSDPRCTLNTCSNTCSIKLGRRGRQSRRGSRHAQI